MVPGTIFHIISHKAHPVAKQLSTQGVREFLCALCAFVRNFLKIRRFFAKHTSTTVPRAISIYADFFIGKSIFI
jgi:hypothetical protein